MIYFTFSNLCLTFRSEITVQLQPERLGIICPLRNNKILLYTTLEGTKRSHLDRRTSCRVIDGPRRGKVYAEKTSTIHERTIQLMRISSEDNTENSYSSSNIGVFYICIFFSQLKSQ